MKKMISLTFAALLAVTSYSLAEEFADMTEEIDAELTQAVETMAEQKESQAENVQPNVPVASQAAVPQRGQRAPQRPMRPQVQKAAPQPPMPPQAQKAPAVQRTQNPRALTRKEIRSMDILDRPNRPGHFYGNTVRHRHGR